MGRQHKKVKGGFDYDSINDTVFCYAKNREYSESKVIDNFIIDFQKDGAIKGIEILNASKVLKVSRNLLRHINEVTLNLDINEKKINIELTIKFVIRNAPRQNMYNIEKINEELLNPINSQLSLA